MAFRAASVVAASMVEDCASGFEDDEGSACAFVGSRWVSLAMSLPLDDSWGFGLELERE